MTESPKPTGRRKIKTMQALSAAIGVSRPTLSRYFQDATSVRRSTRERIETALERLDYVPNFFATRMNRKRTGLIGVIVPYYDDLFFTNLLGSIESAAREAGYTVITQSSHGDPDVETRAAETLQSMNVDGVIVAPLGRSSDARAMHRLSTALPLVFVATSWVSTDRPGASSNGYNENQALFRQGKCAMWIDATSAAGRVFDSTQSEFADKVGFTAAPVAETPKGNAWFRA